MMKLNSDERLLLLNTIYARQKQLKDKMRMLSHNQEMMKREKCREEWDKLESVVDKIQEAL